MKANFKKLPLRNGVGIVVLNKNNKVFVARRLDNPKNFWQMPQGGVDEGEDFLTAAYRELKEETSMRQVELIKEIDGTLTYELPDHSGRESRRAAVGGGRGLLQADQREWRGLEPQLGRPLAA